MDLENYQILDYGTLIQENKSNYIIKSYIKVLKTIDNKFRLILTIKGGIYGEKTFKKYCRKL